VAPAQLPTGMSVPQAIQALERAAQLVEQSADFSVEPLEAALRQLADELGLTAALLFTLLRLAATGQAVSPPLVQTLVILGKPRTIGLLSASARNLSL